MSYNQSMSDKNETQYRKTGRSKSSNQQHRGFSPAYPTGAGAGGPAPSISSNRSFKKSNNNAQGGQSRANVTNVNPSDAGSGASTPSYVAGALETTVTFTPPKQTEPSDPQRSSRAVPASQSAFWAEEQAKQRQLKAILNKRITPQNFKKMFERVKAVNIDNAITLTGVVSQIYEKALMEPTFCEMYANLCFYLAVELPDFSVVDNEKITFKRLLVNKCQEEFERGEREQEEANKADEEGEVKLSEEEREEKRIKARRRIGNIILIGELYKKTLLTERIMYYCILKLLVEQQTQDEEDIEVLCNLMSTIGEMIDHPKANHPKAKKYMDACFERMKSLSNNMNLSSRVRFMLKDTIDLRKNSWQQSRKVKGPKKVEEVHKDAAQERQAHSSILGQESMDFSPRGPTMLSPQMSVGMGNNEVASSKPSRSEQPSAPSQSTEFSGALETTVTFTPPKQTEPSDPQRSSRAVPKAPASQSAFGAEEQAKQRQLKAILNKRITPQNFKKMFERVKAVNIDNATTLTGVISQIYEKALMEPTFCDMFANLCFYLAAELPDFSEDNEKITFKRLLVNKCQEEFERGEREQEEANKADEEGEVKQSEEEREEKRIKARRRMLGNIRLIGELYKKKMLTERIMHECIKKLLGQQQTPDEEDIEALCTLMSTIGEMIDHPKAKEHMDAYFERMKNLSNNMKLSSRVRFMLKDTIDLRKNRWQQRRKVKGPKKIEELHRDALTENVPSEKSEERLIDMSLGAIKEFYSAREEVALCLKDLNSPSFHPSMISVWVTDSFERKDAERDLLAKLLVNLTKSQDGTLSQSQLIKGFERVLSTLEDAVNDAPRAPEFLGLIFAKVILENVVSLNQIGQLIHEGGEEPGHLLEVGLAGNVLGNILEVIKSEKGESVLKEILTSSNLLLETFQPPDPHKSRILEKFI